MGIHSGNEQIETGGDINQISTAIFESDGFFGYSKLSLDVSVTNGSWGATVLEIQCSASRTRWTSLRKSDGTALTVEADSMVMDIEDFKMKYIRVIATTASGDPASVTIIMQGIRS